MVRNTLWKTFKVICKGRVPKIDADDRVGIHTEDCAQRKLGGAYGGGSSEELAVPCEEYLDDGVRYGGLVMSLLYTSNSLSAVVVW